MIGKTPNSTSSSAKFLTTSRVIAKGNPLDSDDKTCHHHVKVSTIVSVQLVRQIVFSPLVCMICDSCGETLCNPTKSAYLDKRNCKYLERSG